VRLPRCGQPLVDLGAIRHDPLLGVALQIVGIILPGIHPRVLREDVADWDPRQLQEAPHGWVLGEESPIRDGTDVVRGPAHGARIGHAASHSGDRGLVLERLLIGAYFAVLLLLAVYGVHRLVIVVLYRRSRSRAPRELRALEDWPRVTVQLPLFNERYVAERLLEAAAAMDYPRERLQIQVDRNPEADSDLFELDFDHTFKDRGQRSVLGRLSIRLPEQSAE